MLAIAPGTPTKGAPCHPNPFLNRPIVGDQINTLLNLNPRQGGGEIARGIEQHPAAACPSIVQELFPLMPQLNHQTKRRNNQNWTTNNRNLNQLPPNWQPIIILQIKSELRDIT